MSDETFPDPPRVPDIAADPFPELSDLDHDGLVDYVRSRVRSAANAADIVQESWLRALIAFRTGRVENHRNFLFRVARNLVIDQYRRDAAQAARIDPTGLSDDLACDHPSPERIVMARQQLDRLMAVVARMPPRRQQVFVMRRFDGLDQADIARALGITRGAVEKHLRLALVHCLDALGDGL